MVSSKVGNVRATMKLKPKLDMVAMLMAVPLIFKGIISEIKIQAIGPNEKAKQAMNKTMEPTDIHFKSRP